MRLVFPGALLGLGNGERGAGRGGDDSKELDSVAGRCLLFRDAYKREYAGVLKQYIGNEFGMEVAARVVSGEDIKVVSEMMRHTSVKITADVYALVLPDLAASVSATVASMIPRAARN